MVKKLEDQLAFDEATDSSVVAPCLTCSDQWAEFFEPPCKLGTVCYFEMTYIFYFVV